MKISLKYGIHFDCHIVRTVLILLIDQHDTYFHNVWDGMKKTDFYQCRYRRK